MKQQLAGVDLARRFLFAWQTSWYSPEILPTFLKSFKAVMESSFVADDTIKPVLSYLAAHLHDGERKINAVWCDSQRVAVKVLQDSLLQLQFCLRSTEIVPRRRRSNSLELSSHSCLSLPTVISGFLPPFLSLVSISYSSETSRRPS